MVTPPTQRPYRGHIMTCLMAQVPFIRKEKRNDGPLGNVQEPAQKLEDEPPPHFISQGILDLNP